MQKWLPFPLMSLALWLIWMLLNQTLSLGQALLALVLAVAIPIATRPLHTHGRARIRKFWLAILMAFHVAWDITVSCWKVCKIVLGSKKARSRSGFITLHLRIRSVHGMTILSSIINSTPGTVWTELSDDNRVLLVHLLDLDEEADFRRLFHERYEKPLMEIFE